MAPKELNIHDIELLFAEVTRHHGPDAAELEGLRQRLVEALEVDRRVARARLRAAADDARHTDAGDNRPCRREADAGAARRS